MPVLRRYDVKTAARNFGAAARRALTPTPESRKAAIDRVAPAKHRVERYWKRVVPAKRRVERYWSETTVRADDFGTPEESAEYLESRFRDYPLYRELSGLWGEHDGETILDYGCGPGNDVVGFLIHTGARRVIGADLSPKALSLARRRIELHDVERSRFELVEVTDAKPDTGLDDASVDYVQSMGVLHHSVDPLVPLREMRRVAKPGGSGRVMVYNRDSVWLHLYVAYSLMVLEGRYAGMRPEEAFEKTTDGPDCPIARCYRPDEWKEICASAGFEAEFLGAYPSAQELDWLRTHREAAIADDRLADEHRGFLSELDEDADGCPKWRGHYAGVGGMYRLLPA